MVTVRIFGGLGNQMFQYAFGFAVAKKLKKKLQLDVKYAATWSTKRDFELDSFKISHNNVLKYRYFLSYKYIRHIVNLLCRLIYKKTKIFQNYEYLYDSFNIENLCKNCYLGGIWQSEKYFADCKEEIRKEFQFKDGLNKESMNILQRFDGQNTVSIHVRRGDYMIELFKDLGLVCTANYYQRAIAHILANVANPVFIVFSEDIEWVKEYIKIPEPCIYVDSLDKPPSHDMQFMSLCKHNIIANSTYSWWAAWLNQNPDKIIIAPDKWWIDGKETDIYTDNMVKISTMEGKYDV